MTTPVFIFSLPRSGSTLLQKTLMAHSEISSISEPWLLLPLCYTFKEKGILTEYSHKTYLKGMNSVYESLPKGVESYHEVIRNACFQLYEKMANGHPFFLDKTPMYFLVIDEIIRIFKGCKFIFLFRNPLGIFASSISGLRSDSTRRMDHLDRILYQGPRKLAQGYAQIGEKACLVRYEDLVICPEECLKNICQYLEINFQKNMLVDWAEIPLKGLGDHNITNTHTINNNTEHWKNVINTCFRKQKVKKYIKSFPSEYLELGSYDRHKMLKEIEDLKIKSLGVNEYYYFIEEQIVRCIKPLCKGTGLS